MGLVIIRLYGKVVMFLICMIIYLKVLLGKKRIIKWEEASFDFKKTIKKNEKKINSTIKIIIGISLLFVIFWLFIPAILDIPNVVQQDYCLVSGKVESWNYSREDELEERVVSIVDGQTGEEVFVNVYGKGIRKGTYMKVLYLPHSKYGTILERNDEGL